MEMRNVNAKSQNDLVMFDPNVSPRSQGRKSNAGPSAAVSHSSYCSPRKKEAATPTWAMKTAMNQAHQEARVPAK